MEPMMERKGTLLLIPILMALLLTGNGCSMLIASRGVSNLDAIATTGSTRQEVRRTLGDPESSETRDDGMRVETYRIRRKVQSLWGPLTDELKGGQGLGPNGGQGLVLLSPILLMGEVYATGKALYDSQTQKYHAAFVYGPDDRLRFLYDVNTVPPARFDAARRPLDELQWKRLENDECPTWSACLTSYVDELRRRAAFVRYGLTPEDEENFRGLLDLARDRDEGRLTKTVALIGIKGTLIGIEVTRWEQGQALWRQLETEGCPSWVACMVFYEKEYRRRGDTPPEAEENFQRLLEIARDRDEGRLTKGQALIGIEGRNGHFERPPRWELRPALWRQLETEGCPSWVACVIFYESEYRNRVGGSGQYALLPEEENELQRLLEIARGKDEGVIAKEDALGQIPSH